eukprot:788268-Prymnesium_polylepis.2
MPATVNGSCECADGRGSSRSGGTTHVIEDEARARHQCALVGRDVSDAVAADRCGHVRRRWLVCDAATRAWDVKVRGGAARRGAGGGDARRGWMRMGGGRPRARSTSTRDLAPAARARGTVAAGLAPA